MKLLILFCFTITSVFAQTDFLNKSEAIRMNDYVSHICADTYCGGDLNFYAQGIVCKGSTCTAEFKAIEYNENTFNISNINQAIGSKKTLKNTEINYTDSEVENDILIVSFVCIMPNLTNPKISISQKEQLIYDLIVRE